MKAALSRTAGRTLGTFARVGTDDATNSFKAYDTAFVREVGIDSRNGFEIGLELTAKARRLRRPVAELPTIWLDRTLGDSHFDLRRWWPKYLRWYLFAYGPQLSVEEVRRAGARIAARNEGAEGARTSRGRRERAVTVRRVLVTGSAGFIGGYVVEELLGRGYEVVGIDNYSKYGPVTKSYDDQPATASSRGTSATSTS